MLTFAGRGWDQYVAWQEEDKKTLQKINSLLKSLEREGAMGGEGKPEKLKNQSNTYSRRIDDKTDWFILPNREILQLNLAKVITTIKEKIFFNLSDFSDCQQLTTRR